MRVVLQTGFTPRERYRWPAFRGCRSFCPMKKPRRSRPHHVFATLTVLSLFAAGSVGGQCPNGTPPPCKGPTPSATVRRPNPPLNDRAWIVVPFGNVTKAPELDWLRDASVNLLTLDLGRWTDISVVDDKRVTDLMRELPAGRMAQPLSLNDGLSLARRAGAGRLVMGDFFKVGKGARFVANVFNVRDGSRLRSISQQTPEQDSLLTAFGPLARGVLAVPPPPDERVGTAGTTRVDAFQEYLLGVSALNRFELTEAKQHLLKALALDSTFAMAHFKLSTTIHWGDTRGDTTERAHALAAARLGGSLPARERALISGRVASTVGEYVRACATLGALVAKDSADVEALYGVGECQYHAGYLEPETVDSISGRFRGNWNRAIAAFRRTLQLDPTYHPAFGHILDVLTAQTVGFCTVQGPMCSNGVSAWNTVVIRNGDSLLMEPRRPGTEAFLDRLRRAEVERSPLLNLRAAQKIAQEWVDAGPTESRARLNLARVDLLVGDVEQADAELRQIGSRTDEYVRRTALQYRVQVAILLGRGGEGRMLLDTLRRELPDIAASNRDLGPLYAAFGQLQRLLAWTEKSGADDRWSPERRRYMSHVPRLMLGLPREELNADERRYWESLPGDTLCQAGRPSCRTTWLLPSLAYAVRARRSWWPYRDVPMGFRFASGYALASRDTAWLRFAPWVVDSIARSRLKSGLVDLGTSVIAADTYLAVGDSAAAIRMARLFVDSIMPGINRVSSGGVGEGDLSMLFVPRMMLVRADLAAAAGSRDEARTWYARVLDLWAQADPELQPTVTRIRAALAAPGPPK